jgi:3-hydroxypropanoate dehydrogenase
MGALAPFVPPRRRPAPRGLGQMLHAAPAHPAWAPTPVSRDTLEQLHALMSVGPGMVDASPTQVLFLTSEKARDRLAPHLGAGVRAEALAAPACALIGYDLDFAEQLVEFLPHVAGAPSCFERPEVVRQTAERNGTLQGAYLIVAARALGLEAAAIEDFHADGLSVEFFRGARVRAIFLCALGYPAETSRPPRRRRTSAEKADDRAPS